MSPSLAPGALAMGRPGSPSVVSDFPFEKTVVPSPSPHHPGKAVTQPPLIQSHSRSAVDRPRVSRSVTFARITQESCDNAVFDLRSGAPHFPLWHWTPTPRPGCPACPVRLCAPGPGGLKDSVAPAVTQALANGP